MTTNPNGPETIMSQYPSFRAGATANVALMDLQSAMGDDAKVAKKVTQVTSEMHDIGATEIVVTTSAEKLRAIGFNQPTAKLYGKPPIIAQSGNFPHGLDPAFLSSDYYNSLDEKGKDLLKRQATLRFLIPFGISNAAYHRAAGPNHSPEQDGLDVIAWGPATTKLFTGTILGVGTDVALDLIPSQATGRAGAVRYQSEGAERYPFTVRKLADSPLNEVIKSNVYELGTRLFASGNNRASNIFAKMINPMHKDSPFLESEKNAATVTGGILGAAAIIIEELINADVLQLTTRNTSPRDVTRSAAWQTSATTTLFFRDSTVAPTAAQIELIKAIIARLAGVTVQRTAPAPAAPVAGAAAQAPAPAPALPAPDALYSVVTRNALTSIIAGVQDAAAVHNRRFGKVLQHIPTASNVKTSATGTFVYDILVTH